jgi:hypothetical protein
VRALARGASDGFVLVGHDEGAGHCTAAELRAALGVPVFSLRERARRGYFSIVAPYFEALAWLAREGVEFDWLVYLSGQDYPTQPIAALERKLAAEGRDGYLRHWRADAEPSPWGRRRQGFLRYRLQYLDLPRAARPLLRLFKAANGAQTLWHLHLTYGERLGLRWPGDPFRRGAVCWAGKQWSVLGRAAVERLREAAAGAPELMRWFARTVCPDEAVVQTLLLAAGGLDLVDDDLRFVDFAGSRDGHPRYLDAADLPALADPRYYFARKFDPVVAPELLDRLDARLAG